MLSTWCRTRFYTHETYIASISRLVSGFSTDLDQDYIQKFLKNSWSNLILLHFTNWNIWINGLSFVIGDKFCVSLNRPIIQLKIFWNRFLHFSICEVFFWDNSLLFCKYLVRFDSACQVSYWLTTKLYLFIWL